MLVPRSRAVGSRDVLLVLLVLLYGSYAYRPGSNRRNPHAFAAVLSDGSVGAWGNSRLGGVGIVPGLTDVDTIVSNYGAFTAIKNDGTTHCWGDSSSGGYSMPAGLAGVSSVAVTEY